MGTLTQAITGLSSADPVPGAYVEVLFAQGPVTAGSGTKKVLFIGPMTASGTATKSTLVYSLGTLDDTKAYFGVGSPIYRMHRRFLDVCKTAQVYGVATADPATAAVAASDTITFATTSTGTGVADYTICGEKISVGIVKSATVTAIATSLKNQINLSTHLPVTAVSTGGVVTVTSRVKGTNGNKVRHRGAITSGIGTTMTVANSVLQSGATDEVITAALSTILASQYDYIVPAVNAAGTADTRVGLVQAQIIAQALPTVGIRQQGIVCHGGTSAQGITFAAATNGCQNKPRMQCIWQEDPEWEPMEIAAHWAAARFNMEAGDPGYNFDGYGKGVNDVWFVPKQYSEATHPTRAELSTAISGGLTPIAVEGGTKTYVVRSCTTSTDVRVRDTSKVTVADKFATDLAARYASQWSGAKVQDDPSNDNVQVAASVCTPNRLKGLTIAPLYKQYANDGWLDSDKTMDKTSGDLVACVTGIDPSNATRINARCPLHVTPLLHQFGALVSENSSG